MRGRIVVGVNGSPAAAAALAWAVFEARLRGAELVACSVVEPRRAHDSIDAGASSAVAESAAGYPTTVLTPRGNAGVELLAACVDADLLVVGPRGRRPVAGALLGSVSRTCLKRAPCPVVVVGQPHHAWPFNRVIVGVDGSVHSREALLLAAEEARLRGATLQVLHAVHWDNRGTELIIPTPEQLLAWGHTLVDAELVATGVIGEATVVYGRPGEQLLGHSEGADLLVLGTRGHNPLASVLLGSVSEHCVRHTPCPVMVTRAHHQRSPEGRVQTSSTEVAT